MKNLLIEMVDRFPFIKLSMNGNSLLVRYKNTDYLHECYDKNELAKVERLLRILNNLAMNYPEIDVTIHSEDTVLLHSNMWKENPELDLEVFNFEKLNILINITQYVKSRDGDINVSLNPHYDGTVMLESPNWRRALEFGEDINEDDIVLNNTFDNIRNFFESEYKEREYCYRKNYIEFPIMVGNNEGFYGLFEELQSEPERFYDNGLTFEISKISEYFWSLIFKDQRYEFEELYEDTHISTLKIYNLNSFLNINCEDSTFVGKGYEAAKNILFKLSHQYSIHLEIVEIPDFDDESFIDDHYEEMESFDNIDEHTLLKLYDKDLIYYYYRAMNMEKSEFKYLAYYQILECIFDEVHLHATIQGVKQIINSDWFSKHSDEDIKTVIEIVGTYNHQRNDRGKLLIVLEKYFKGSLNDKAFLAANRSIINILKEMELIKQDRDLNDLQKIVDIIYNYRCECTHSNRTFPARGSLGNSKHELKNYINLIKKLTQIIIINYERK